MKITLDGRDVTDRITIAISTGEPLPEVQEAKTEEVVSMTDPMSAYLTSKAWKLSASGYWTDPLNTNSMCNQMTKSMALEVQRERERDAESATAAPVVETPAEPAHDGDWLVRNGWEYDYECSKWWHVKIRRFIAPSEAIKIQEEWDAKDQPTKPTISDDLAARWGVYLTRCGRQILESAQIIVTDGKSFNRWKETRSALEELVNGVEDEFFKEEIDALLSR